MRKNRWIASRESDATGTRMAKLMGQELGELQARALEQALEPGSRSPVEEPCRPVRASWRSE